MTLNVPRKLVNARLIGLIWVMIFAFLFSWFSYYCIFKAMYQLKPTEKLVFFIETNGLLQGKPETFQKMMDDEEMKKDGLIDISYYPYDTAEEDKPFIKNVINEIDFVILPGYELDNFVGMKDDCKAFADLIEIKDFYTLDYQGLALKIYDGDDQEYNKHFTFDTWLPLAREGSKADFYLLVSNYSQNFDRGNNHILGYLGLNILLTTNTK